MTWGRVSERSKRKNGIDVPPYVGKVIYPSVYLITQKPMAYAIVNGTLSRYEYYQSQSDEGG